MIKDEGRALLLCCGLQPAERRITAFSRPREHMWLVKHMDRATLLFSLFKWERERKMAACYWNKDLAWIGLHLAGTLPNSFTPHPPTSFPCFFFLSAPRLGIQQDPTHDTDPQPLHHVPYIAFFPGKGWNPPPPPFYFRPVPISWNAPQKHVQGFELSPLFPKLVATFRLLRWRPCGCVSECNLDSFTVLSFHKCHRDPVMTREEYMIN